MRRSAWIVLASALAIAATVALGARSAEAHGGGLNACGCHVEHRTAECHCHRDSRCGCACQPSHCE